MSTFNENGFSIKEQILAIVALLLIVAITGWFLPLGGGSRSSILSGASGTQYIEDYDPLVMQAGLNTSKAVTFGSTLTVSGLSTFSGVSAFAGGATSTGAFTVTGAWKTGQNGTSFSQVREGLCYIYPYAATITASSTANFDCQATSNASGGGGAGALAPLPGVAANDFCLLQLSTTTAGTTFATAIQLNGVGASTTAGYITGHLVNNAGTFTWPTSGTATGTAYYRCSR